MNPLVNAGAVTATSMVKGTTYDATWNTVMAATLADAGRNPLTKKQVMHAQYVPRALAVISPPLDAAGNSVRAQKAITDISNALGGNPYSATPR
jgi:glutaminase